MAAQSQHARARGEGRKPACMDALAGRDEAGSKVKFGYVSCRQGDSSGTDAISWGNVGQARDKGRLHTVSVPRPVWSLRASMMCPYVIRGSGIK